MGIAKVGISEEQSVQRRPREAVHMVNGKPSKVLIISEDGIRLGCTFVTTAVVQYIADRMREEGKIV